MSADVRREDFWANVEERLAKPEPWERRRAARLTVEFYGAICAAAGSTDSPEVPPSLATCEQLHRSGAVPDFSTPPFKTPSDGETVRPTRLSPAARDTLDLAFRLGVEGVDRAVRLATSSTDAPEILFKLLERGDEERTAVSLGLLEEGEVSAAKRFAACNRQSAQLECPDEFAAGGCGCEENYVPITCDHLLCEHCGKRRVGRAVETYLPAARTWAEPTFYTFTIPNVSDPVKGVEAVKGAFGRFRRRTVPAAGSTVREGAVKRWAWARDGGEPADLWKPKLLDAGQHDLVRRLQQKYVDQGRNVPLEELLRGGVYGVDVKEKAPDEFNVHLHVLADASYVPQAALSAVWEDVSGAPVVDVRRIYNRGEGSLEEAVAETVAYSVKAPELEELETAVEFAVAMKGKRLVQSFGSLHGETERPQAMLLCAECEATPNWWNYLGVVDEHRSNMGSVHGSDGDRPPPEC